MIDKILLGHNQFFGVNHLSAQGGNQRAAYFSDVNHILDMVQYCYDLGVRGMMMSTHERALLVNEALLQQQELRENLGIYLLVPYAAKYIRMANEKGIVNIVRDSLSGTTMQEKIATFWRGGFGLLTKDVHKIITALIDFEVGPFTQLKLRAVFLHDVLTDLILGWDVPEVLKTFARHVEERYQTRPAFCTKNLPLAIKSLRRVGIENPLLMASINKVGYQVNPSLPAFEQCLRTEKVQLLAMSTLAAGYLKPREAYEYLYSLPNVVSTVVGVSKKQHAKETFETISGFLAAKDSTPAGGVEKEPLLV